MAKSRRKHSGFNGIEESPQGRRFLQSMYEMVGGGLTYVPLERLGDKSHVFRIDGKRAWGLLVERPEQQEADTWSLEWGFRLVEPVDEEVLVQATLSARRWDPWLAFGHDPDSPVRKASKKQRKEWRLQRARSGAESDHMVLTVQPRGTEEADLVRIADATLRQLAERYPPDEPRPGVADGSIATLRDRVQDILLDAMERVEIDRDGDFSFAHGSTRVFVRVLDGPGSGAVSVWAVTNVAVPSSPELFEFIATNADAWLFGHLSAHAAADGTAAVILSHRLFGDFLEDEELVATLSVVASTADEIDEDIQQRFGGEIFSSPPLAEQVPRPPADPPTGMYL